MRATSTKPEESCLTATVCSLRTDKCTLGTDSCEFQDHVAGSGRVIPGKNKTEASREFARPQTKPDVRAWLGLTGYYHRFILTDALGSKKPDSIAWNEDMDKEFEDLKIALTNNPILAAPDFSLPFILHTDASGRGIGGVLSQKIETPTAFYSKKLNPAQKRYTATEKEALAAVKSIQDFATYLMGKKFTLYTNHKAIVS